MEFVLAFITLALLEIILGIDNIIFVSIVSNRVDEKRRKAVRFWGLVIAMVFRILLLVSLVWVIDHLSKPLFPLPDKTMEEVVEEYKSAEALSTKLSLVVHTIGVRELVLLIGGLFLIAKSVSEVHHKMEVSSKEVEPKVSGTFNAILQIVAVDIVFSFDSILTAIGITHNLPAMISAIIVSVFFMIFFAKYVSDFMQQHPSLEVLALSFLILIGFMLVLDSVHIEVPRGYVYFALFFSLAVEFINIRIRKHKIKPVKLNPKIKDQIKNEENGNATIH